jgi:hypothetical protein
MSIEALIGTLIEAVEANTFTLRKLVANGGATSAAESGSATPEDKPARGRPPKNNGGGGKPAHSRSELTAVMSELREAQGVKVAKDLIKSVGKSDKLNDVPDGNVDALFLAAKKALGEEEGAEEAAGDGL